MAAPNSDARLMAVASDLGGTPSGVPPVLVLVTPNCPACERVPEIVDGVKSRLPELRVTVLDVSAQDVPDGVPFVGTPTYIIDDRIVSLGNPDPDDLVLILEGWRSRER